MIRLAALAALAALVTIAACTSPSAPVAALNEEFTLAVGEQVDVESAGTIVRFVRVVSDSRCPSDVQCVWAGNAQIALELRRGAHRDTVALNTLDGAREVVIDQYRVCLVSLAPVPMASDPIESGKYRATLLVVAVIGEGCLRGLDQPLSAA